MERKRQREIVIGVVAVAIAAIAIYRISTTFTPASTADPASQPGVAPSRQQTAGQTDKVPRVDLEALKAQRPEPVDSRRDPFRFRPKAAPPSQQPTPQQMQPPPMPVNTGPAEPPPPPRIQLKYIGILETGKTGLVAIFSDGRGTPFYGKQGEVVDGRYKILRIGVESADLAYLDGRGRQTIRFTGQ
jgi:hypothetical protein